MSNDDLRKQMMFDSSKKSTGVAYLLWLFLGGLGAHRFYLGRVPTAVGQLALALLGWLPLMLGWVALGIWLVVDAFLIPSMISEENIKIANTVLDPEPEMINPTQNARIID